MLKWCRTRASALAPVLLLSLLALAAPHIGGSHHDADSDISPVGVHDHSAHRIGSSSPITPSATQHCAICHWSRSFRFFRQVTVLAAAYTEAAPIVLVEAFIVINAGLAGLPPLRSPPTVRAFA